MTVAKSPEWYRQVWLQWMRKTKDDAGATLVKDEDIRALRERLEPLHGKRHLGPMALCGQCLLHA